jgi:WD40 repeat protein
MSGRIPDDPPTLRNPSPPNVPSRRLEKPAEVGPSLSLQELLEQAGALPFDELRAVLRSDQFKRWQRGERVLVEVYRQRWPSLQADEAAVLDLILNEILLREERAEAPQLEEYVQRFPAYAGKLQRWFEVQQTLQTNVLGNRAWPATLGKGPDQRAADGALVAQEEPGPAAPAEAVDSRVGTLVTPTPRRDAVVNERVSVPGYEILREIGRGGMGVVYVARQRGLKRLVALKMILAGQHAGAEQAGRFRAEAEAVAHLQHPHIVQIYEVGEHEGRPYFSLEYLEGGSLSRKLGGVPLEPRQAARLLEMLAGAMHYAHQRGIVHRDLKPANILLTAEGLPKISDFGLAKQMDEDRGQTQTGAILGTPSYMPPEQAAGQARVVGPLADVYALGAILYELLTGRPPFRAANYWDTLLQVRTEEPVPPSHLQPKLPRDLETICLKCLHKEPGQRYASAEALAEDLRHFLAGEPIRARPTSWLERGIKQARRNPMYFLLALTGVVLVAVALGGWLVAGHSQNPEKVLLFLFILPLTLGVISQALAAYNQRRRAVEQRAQADAARREAEDERARAEAARREAEEHARNAEAALRKSETSLYFHSIALAEREWLGNNVGRAEELLDACPRALRHWEWHYLKRLCHADRLTLAGHTDWVRGVAYSPDGLCLASAGGYDQTVRIWDAATGQEIAQLPGHGGCVQDVTFSHDGQQLASAGADGTVKVWHADHQEQGITLSGHTDAVVAVAFHPDGQQLASASEDQTVRVWDVARGRSLRCLRGHGNRVWGVAFHPNGQQLATAGEDQTIKVWEAKSEREVLTLRGHTGAVVGVAYSPDGRRLASAGQDHTVRIWDAATGQELLTLRGHADRVCGVAFSPDGNWLASAGKDRVVKVWDTSTGRELRTLRGHRDTVWRVAFTPNGRQLASAAVDHTVKVWDAAASQEAITWAIHQGLALSVAFHPNGQCLATVGGGLPGQAPAEVLVWDVATGRKAYGIAAGKSRIGSAIFSPDGRRLATTHEYPETNGGAVKVWDAATGQKLLTFAGHTRPVVGIAFSPDSRRLASGSLDGTVKVWDAATGREQCTFRGHLGHITSVAFSPDHCRIASACGDALRGDGEVKVWDAGSGQELLILRGHAGDVTRVAFSPDGQRLATAGQDQTARLWDANSGLVLRTLRGHAKQVVDVAFTADGNRLATASHDQTVKVWDVASGQEILTLRGHTAEVLGVALSTDSQRLASAGADHTVKIWNATPVTAGAAPSRGESATRSEGKGPTQVER